MLQVAGGAAASLGGWGVWGRWWVVGWGWGNGLFIGLGRNSPGFGPGPMLAILLKYPSARLEEERLFDIRSEVCIFVTH